MLRLDKRKRVQPDISMRGSQGAPPFTAVRDQPGRKESRTLR
jgi:hypothetical protein